MHVRLETVNPINESVPENHCRGRWWVALGSAPVVHDGRLHLLVAIDRRSVCSRACLVVAVGPHGELLTVALINLLAFLGDERGDAPVDLVAVGTNLHARGRRHLSDSVGGGYRLSVER